MFKQVQFKKKNISDLKSFNLYNKNMNKLKEDINKLKEKNKNLLDLILYASQHFGNAWGLMLNSFNANSSKEEFMNGNENKSIINKLTLSSAFEHRVGSYLRDFIKNGF